MIALGHLTALVVALAGCDQVFDLTRPPDAAVDPVDAPVDATVRCAPSAGGVVFASPAKGTAIVAGRFDAGDSVDLAIGSTTRSAVLLRPNLGGDFSSEDTVDTMVPALSLAAGDVNHDGLDDIAYVTAGTAGAALRTAAGWETRTALLVGGAPATVFVADLNQQGLDDLVVPLPSGQLVQLVEGGTAYARAAAIPTTAGTPAMAIATDVDGEGHGDVIAAITEAGGVVLYRYMAGDYVAENAILTGTRPVQLVLGTLGNRATPDLVVVNEGSNTLTVLRIGNGTLAGGMDLAVGTSPRAVAIADVTNDGLADLVVANNKDNTVSLYRGTPTSFEVREDLGTVAKPIALAVADFTGDGHPDLAVLGEDAGFAIHASICTSL